MTDDRHPNDADQARPDAKDGLEVGGGDKAAVASAKQKEPKADPEPARPEDEDEAQSPT